MLPSFPAQEGDGSQAPGRADVWLISICLSSLTVHWMEPDAGRDVTSTLILWVGARVSGVGLRGSWGGGGGISKFFSFS